MSSGIYFRRAPKVLRVLKAMTSKQLLIQLSGVTMAVCPFAALGAFWSGLDSLPKTTFHTGLNAGRNDEFTPSE